MLQYNMVLITGANGLLGSQICKNLLEHNIQCKALVRETSSLEFLEKLEGLDIVYGDILDPLSVENALKDVNLVIHAAAIVSFDPNRAEDMYNVNVEGTKNIVNACLIKGIKDLIHISSIAATSLSKGDDIVDENTKWPGTIKSTNYGLSKHLAELEIWRSQAEGINVTILAPSTVLSPGNWKNSSAMLFKYVYDQKVFYTHGALNYIDMRDLNQIIKYFVENGTDNEKYIINGGKIMIKEFFDKIGAGFNKRPPFIKANKLLVYMAVIMEWIKSKITGNSPLITVETARRGKNIVFYNNVKIKNKLNFSFTSIDDSIEWTCKELKRHYNL